MNINRLSSKNGFLLLCFFGAIGFAVWHFTSASSPYSTFSYPYQLKKETKVSADKCLQEFEAIHGKYKYLNLENPVLVKLLLSPISQINSCITDLPEQLTDTNYLGLTLFLRLTKFNLFLES